MKNQNKVKLLYAVTLSSPDRQKQSVTVDDLLKPVQILEDADSVLNRRKSINFGNLANNFVKLSNLTTSTDSDNCLSQDLHTNSNFNLKKKHIESILLPTGFSELDSIKTNDSVQHKSDGKNNKFQRLENKDSNLRTDKISAFNLKNKITSDVKSAESIVSQNSSNSCDQSIFSSQLWKDNSLFEVELSESNAVALGEINVSEHKETKQAVITSPTSSKAEIELHGLTYSQLFNEDFSVIKENKIEKDKGNCTDGENMPFTKPRHFFSATAGHTVKAEGRSLHALKNSFQNDSATCSRTDSSVFLNNYQEKTAVKQTNFSFCTAGGRTVQIDAKSLENAKCLLECDLSIDPCTNSNDDESELGKQENQSIVTTDFSFSTAAGRTIHVDANSLEDVKVLLENDLATDYNHPLLKLRNDKIEENPPISNVNALPHFSFSTAGGRAVDVDAKSLKDVKALLESDLAADHKHPLLKLNDKNEESPPISNVNALPDFRFSTAGGRSVTVDAKSLKDVKALLESDLGKEPCSTSVNPASELPTDERKPSFLKPHASFSTAGGRTIHVDAESLEDVKVLLENDLATDHNYPLLKLRRDENEENPPIVNVNALPHFSFSTAGGRSVTVDAKSLKDVKVLLEGDLGTDSCSTSGNPASGLKNCEGKPSFLKPHASFSTAGGRSVTVDAKSLKDVKTLLESDLGKEPCSTSVNPASELTNHERKQSFLKPHASFSTAGGRSVTVDAKSLKDVKVLLESDLAADCNHPSIKLSDCTTEEKLPVIKPHASFSTAGGRSVTVDAKCLKDVKDLFEGDLTADHYHPPLKLRNDANKESLPVGKSPFSFSTAGGRSINVDAKILEDVKVLFESDLGTELFSASELTNCNDEEKPHLLNPEPSFSTAGGRPVDVDAKSLEEVKVLFESDLTDGLEEGFDDTSVETIKLHDSPKTPLGILDTPDSEEKSNISQLLVNDQTYFEQAPDSLVPNFNFEKNNSSTTNISEEFHNHSLGFTMNSDCNGVVSNSQTLDHMGGKVDDSNTQLSGMSVIYEVSESAAALMKDEQSGQSLGIVTSPSMCVERSHPNVSIVSLCDSQGSGFTTITNRMSNFAYTPTRVKYNPEKRKMCVDIESEQCDNKKPKIDQPTENETIEMLKNLRKWQEELIKKKTNTKVSVEKGELLNKKLESADRSSWRRAVNGIRPKLRTKNQLFECGLNKDIIEVTSTTASSFQFDANDFYKINREDLFKNGMKVGCDSYLVFNENLKAGLDEIVQCFLAAPGVDPRLVPEGWIANHYRWIVWKLASMERSFPSLYAGRCLNPENLLQQLKYRYDREIDMAQRSAFKKILEGDESPGRMFICCIASIRKNNLGLGESSCDLELSDGWYSIWVTIDQEMITILNKGTLQVGSKLVVTGAELINPDQSCDPIKAGKEPILKIFTNSCRRARWDAKMGFRNSPNFPSVKLGSILPNGGIIKKVTACVARVYPILHMSKDSDGKIVFRNDRTESLEIAKNEKLYDQKAEALFDQTWKEVQEKYIEPTDIRAYTKKVITSLTQPEILWNIIEQSGDTSIQELLSNEQLELVANYREQITSKIRQEVQELIKIKINETIPNRNVKSLLKVRLIDLETEVQALLTVWRPTEEIFTILRENKIVTFNNLTATGNRERVLQLSSTRQTRYEEISCSGSDKFSRKLTVLSELNQLHKNTCRPIGPLSGEIDVVGVVIHVKLPERPKGPIVVYLTNLEEDYLAICFWTALKVFGCEHILTEDSLVCCTNLQWRNGSGAWRIPNVFATELSAFSQYPKLQHLKNEFSKIKLLLDSKKLSELMAEHKLRLLTLLKKREYSSLRISSPSSPSTTAVVTNDCFIDEMDMTPIQKKIRKLNSYGRAPPLTPLPLFSKSPDLSHEFRSPCHSERSRGSSSPLSLDSS